MPRPPDFGNIQRLMGFKDPYTEHVKVLRTIKSEQARDDLADDFQHRATEITRRRLHAEDREATHIDTTEEKVRSFHTAPFNTKSFVDDRGNVQPRFRSSVIPPVNVRTGKLNGKRIVAATGERTLTHVHILDNTPGILDRVKARFRKTDPASRYVNPKQAEQQAKRRRKRAEKRAAQAS